MVKRVGKALGWSSEEVKKAEEQLDLPWSREEYEESLKLLAEKHGMTVEEFKKTLTVEEFERMLDDEIKRRKIIDEVVAEDVAKMKAERKRKENY